MFLNRLLPTIRSKLFCLVFTMFVAALLLQAGYLYERFRGRQADQFRVNLDMARAVAGTFNVYVRDVLHQELAIGINLTLARSFSVEQMNQILEANRSALPSIRNFAWVNPEGRIVASSMESVIGAEIADRPFINSVAQGSQWAVSDLFLSSVTDEPVFSITRGIRNSEGKLLGIVVATVRAEKLVSVLGLDLSQSGEIGILDGRAMLVDCYPKRELKWEDRDLFNKRPAIRQALEGKEVTGNFRDFSDSQERIVTCTPSRFTNWVVCVRSKSQVMAPIRSQAIVLAGFALVLTAAVFVAAFFLSAGVVDPIRRLRDYALALGRGDPARRIEFKGSVELQDLASSLSKMAEEISIREDALRKSEEKYRELVENANCIITRVNLNGTITFFNEFAQSFFGYTEEEILGRHVIGTIVPETDSAGQNLRMAIHDVMRNPHLYAMYENENIRKNGDRVWVMWANKALFAEGGKVCGVLSIGTDITARKMAEDKLRRSEQEKDAILNSLKKVAVYYLDCEMRVIWTNATSKQVFGLTHEELKEKKCYEVIHGLSEPCSDCTAIKAVQTGEAQQGEISRGEKTWLVYSNPVKDSSGKVANVVHAAMNITDRKRMEQALRTEISERRQMERMRRLDEARLEALWQLSQLSESSTNQIAEFTLEKTVKLTGSEVGWVGFLDEAQRVMTVHTWPANAVKRGPAGESLQIPVERADLAADAIREKRVVVINDYASSRPGSGCFLGSSLPVANIMIVPIFENDRIVAVAGVGNKTGSYELSDSRQLTLLIDGMWKIIQRQKAERSLRESESLAAMGRAMAAVAHDMKTPLIAIGGFTRRAQKAIEANSPVQQQLEIVVRETRRMENMVKSMLDFSRPLKLECSSGDVGQLVAECLALVAPLAQEKKIKLCSRLDSDIPPDLCLDFMRMKQALINILNNAIQASKEGEEVNIECNVQGGILSINVIDYGCGVPHDKRQEIFSPFCTSKKEGTGLGLPIVKKIVDAHNGHVEIHDNPDRGITVRVEIPIGLPFDEFPPRTAALEQS